MGIAVNLPYGSTFAAATNEMVRVNFLVAINTNASSSTTVSFASVPVQEQLADAFFNGLPVSFASGTVTIAGVTNFEGDLNGDVRLTLEDWLAEGQFVAQLAVPTSPSQFQRADCAPRSTLGDADLTVIDWVQTGRYALGLDPLTVTGGPTAASGTGTPAPPSGTRLLTVSSPTVQMGLVSSANLTISLAAQGNENAVGFTLSFPPSNFSFNSAGLGSGAAGTMLILNTNQASAGLVAAVLALPPGNSFSAGLQQLLCVNLNLVGTNSGVSSANLTSQLIKCEVSDPFANPLPVSFINGAVTVYPIPSLAIRLLRLQRPPLLAALGQQFLSPIGQRSHPARCAVGQFSGDGHGHKLKLRHPAADQRARDLPAGSALILARIPAILRVMERKIGELAAIRPSCNDS